MGCYGLWLLVGTIFSVFSNLTKNKRQLLNDVYNRCEGRNLPYSTA